MSKSMREEFATNGHLQRIADGEVHDALPARRMFLGKKDLLVGSEGCPPGAYTSFKCSTKRIRVLSRKSLLQRIE
jgi:hypothetical protein